LYLRLFGNQITIGLYKANACNSSKIVNRKKEEVGF